MAMKILITGANGFVGRALCKELANSGLVVRGALRSHYHAGRMPTRVTPVEVGSLGSETGWSSALEGVEVVVHLAARVHCPDGRDSDSLAVFRNDNVVGTQRLAREAARSGVKRLVFISSIKVNGEGRAVPYSEIDIPAFVGSYAQSKWEAENQLLKIAEETGLETVIIRSPLVYGPGVKANFLRLLGLTRRGLPLPLRGVKSLRSMIYVGNLVSAVMLSLNHPTAAGETFLVSDGEDVSSGDLIKKIASAMGRRAVLLPVPIVVLRALGFLTGKKAEIDRLTEPLCVDSGKIRNILDWQPPYTLDQGIQETVDWYLGSGRD